MGPDIASVRAAHDFGIDGREPDKTEKLPELELKPGGYNHQHMIYLWQARNSNCKSWVIYGFDNGS